MALQAELKAPGTRFEVGDWGGVFPLCHIRVLSRPSARAQPCQNSLLLKPPTARPRWLASWKREEETEAYQASFPLFHHPTLALVKPLAIQSFAVNLTRGKEERARSDSLHLIVQEPECGLEERRKSLAHAVI